MQAPPQNFKVIQQSPELKKVTLTGKYELTPVSQYFHIIELLTHLIKEKHEASTPKMGFPLTFFSSLEFILGKCKMEDEKCMICLEQFQIRDFQKECAADSDEDVFMLDCSHKYHRLCLLSMIGEKEWAKCPVCSTIFGKMTGDQPDGKMNVRIDKNMTCQGEKKGTIIIQYRMHGGQRNGKHYPGTSRVGYLPDTPQGNQVLELLRECFDRKLTFTVGRSVTTGMDNQIVWNGIHHKTMISGGAANFGYPDPTYLKRVKEELAAKGIVGKKK